MDKDIHMVNKYWRAANYLTVAFMYLKDNIFLKRKLLESDLKEHPSGHWGTSSGINFIIAHLNRYICTTKSPVQLVIGPGHAGNSLFVNLLLEGTLAKYYPIQTDENVSFDIGKIHECMSMIRTEISPFLPGTVYDGGELGYSLAVAFGTVFDNPDLMTVCIIGDGEFETGCISSSWRCKKYLDQNSGIVLPIVHLNGYRMGDHSLLSQYSDEEITMYFKSMGYIARFASMDHYEMIEALNWVDEMHKSIKAGEQSDWPVLVIRSLKGCTAPDRNQIRIQGTLDAHKNPLRKLNQQETVDYVQNWLESYHSEGLFDENGFLNKEIMTIIPERHLKIGERLECYIHKRLELPDIKEFALYQKNENGTYPNISILEGYIHQIMQDNQCKFLIVSPDELKSNLLGKLKNEQSSNSIMEILNENICQGWMQGYEMTGRNCMMISYEAFMPIITSMVSQFSKWLYQSQRVPWRQKKASMIYILTSLWEANTYSHQNPEFINNLIGSQHEFIRIHMPIDANTLLACLRQCLISENQIHSIIVSKQSMPQMLDIETAISCVDKGYVQWDYQNTSKGEIDLILLAIGDYPTRECNESIKMLQQVIPGVNIRMISILELTRFGDKSIYPHAMSEQKFDDIFPREIPIICCFHGYSSVMKALLFERMYCRKIYINGYDNRSTSSVNNLNKMILNGVSRYQIVLQSCKVLQGKYSSQTLNAVEKDMQNTITRAERGLDIYD